MKVVSCQLSVAVPARVVEGSVVNCDLLVVSCHMIDSGSQDTRGVRQLNYQLPMTNHASDLTKK